ncbi:MAG: TerB family tellurite resistance protein [Alphaproteobacteria bacterium]
MSIWQRIIGGATKLAGEGPLAGLVAALDPTGGSGEGEPGDATQQVAFTIGVVALGAKMAKADGVVTADEIAAFRQVFKVPPEDVKNVGRVFNMARRDAGGFEPYAKQIAKLLSDRPRVLEDLLHCLFHIAKADNVIHPAEIEFLEAVARIFGFSDDEFLRIRAHHLGPEASDPYLILGIAHDAGDEDVKRAYRALVRENHPDRLIAQGVPQEFLDMANDKLAAINEAYKRITGGRALNRQ